jgi:hypothetical protein
MDNKQIELCIICNYKGKEVKKIGIYDKLCDYRIECPVCGTYIITIIENKGLFDDNSYNEEENRKAALVRHYVYVCANKKSNERPFKIKSEWI